jgi:hypothetical protein
MYMQCIHLNQLKQLVENKKLVQHRFDHVGIMNSIHWQGIYFVLKGRKKHTIDKLVFSYVTNYEHEIHSRVAHYLNELFILINNRIKRIT